MYEIHVLSFELSWLVCYFLVTRANLGDTKGAKLEITFCKGVLLLFFYFNFNGGYPLLCISDTEFDKQALWSKAIHTSLESGLRSAS